MIINTLELGMKKKSGQILVVVLLVVVVALAVGLSVASRNLTNLKTSTQAEQSQRAFTAAEGGVENTLSNLNNVATVIQTGTANSGCTRDTTDTTKANCSLGFSTTPSGIDSSASNSNVVVKANSSYERTVQVGDVAQVNMKGMVTGNTVVVKWAKKSNANESTPNNATLEFTFVCNNTTQICAGDNFTTTYGQHREAVTVDTISSQSGGFTTCNQTGTFAGFVTSTTTDTAFACTATLTLPAGNFELLRIKPFWNNTTINVSGNGLPVQTYDITSTATTDSGLSRKIQVSRDALPQLPAIFDYVLYSGQDIIK